MHLIRSKKAKLSKLVQAFEFMSMQRSRQLLEVEYCEVNFTNDYKLFEVRSSELFG